MTKPEQSCGICSEEFSEASSVTVTCNGPCGNPFHHVCADVDSALLNTCTANGILWFCPSCRLDYDEGTQHWESALQDTIQRMSGEIQKLAEKVESIEENCFTKQLNQGASSSGVTVSSVPKKQYPELPVEIWAKAFRNLKYEEWCNARFVSSQWRDIVDGDCILMSKFIMRFPTIDQNFEQVPMLPASKIIFKNNEIATVGSWWTPRITEKLVNLELDNCKISLMNLLTMLRQSPNLVSLSCCGISLFYEEAVATFSDVQLEKLENLTLGCVEQDEVLKIFNKMCPQLKDFALLSDYHTCYNGVLEIIKTVSSLEGISVVSSCDDLSHFVGVNHEFKRVSLAVSTKSYQVLQDKLSSFFEKQPSLEHFDLEIRAGFQSMLWGTLFQNLPRLKRLSISYSLTNMTQNPSRHINLQCTESLTELEYLSFQAIMPYTQLSFSRARHPQLKELFLSNISFRMRMNAGDRCSISMYIANASNLSILTLDRCDATSWSDLFAAIESKGLRRLKLSRMNVMDRYELPRTTPVDYEYLNELRYLEITGGTMPGEFSSTLFGLCHQLEELHLAELQNVCDSVILDLCLQLTQLRKLTLRKCAITDASVKYITDYGRNLQQLTIENCKELTTGGMAQLKAAKIEKVEIK